MGSLGQYREDERETIQRGCFPTSSKRSLEVDKAVCFSIFEHEALEALGLSTFDAIKRTAIVSWAILLRSYLRTNLVSFNSLQDERPDAVEHAHYRLIDHARLDEIHEEKGMGLGRFESTYIDINTAILQTKNQRTVSNGEAEVQQIQAENRRQYILTLNVDSHCPGITMTYLQPAISKQYAQAVISTYQDIFRAVCDRPHSKLGEIDCISEADYRAMISWNPQNPFDSEEYQCMHWLVEAKARDIPREEAICAWDGSLSYFELNHLASLAAIRLVQAGVRPGVFAPFAYEKTMWAVVATLAILKAGGAFVPINPNDPVSRLAELLDKVNATVVVTMNKFVPKFGPLVKTVIVISEHDIGVDKALDTSVDEASPPKKRKNGFPKHVIPSPQACVPNGTHPETAGEVKPTDPIVILFTSGSTGQPKGIVLEHRAICTHAMVHGSIMGYHSARVLQFAAHTFDVAIMDYFTTLIFGGCICIPSEEERKSDIVGVINKMRADYALLTPSFAGLIDPSEVPTMRTLAIGGEALPQDRVQRWAENVHLIQVYGPAEVGICLTMDMKRDMAPETVGFPLSNSSCWLVDPDDYDALVPIGTVGELMIAGPSVARGYLNNEAKTSASFIHKPKWAAKLGLNCDRFYLSGDLLRYNTNAFNGAYDIIGRKDAQIKLRGQRIEPAEIEYHIGKISEVAVSMVTRPVKGSLADELVCVVQIHDQDSISSRVYDEPIRLAKSQDLTAERLRDQLTHVLPSYMIPSNCLTIEKMPLVPSLKIDRRHVNSWLTGLETIPGRTKISHISLIPPNEPIALALSRKICSIVAADDEKRRSALDGNDFILQSIGINSIQIISLAMYLQREHSAKISIDTLLSADLTVRKLAQIVDKIRVSRNGSTNGDHTDEISLGITTPHVDIAHEIEKLTVGLFKSIPPKEQSVDTQSHQNHDNNIFLTGATGYLGSIILHRLLLSTAHSKLFALVRCSNPAEGLDRIIAAAQLYNWWHPTHQSRIHIWPGDLTKPNLSLSPSQLHLLTTSTSTIIHNGAHVHYSSSYPSLFPTNITPTHTLLRLATTSPSLKTFTFVSGGLKPHTPPSLVATLAMEAGGYAQTKHVSAALVAACSTHPAFRSKQLQIVKPGYIIGALSTGGVANKTDFIWRLLAGCVEIGAVNADEGEHWLFIADVEEVADAVIGAPNAAASYHHGSGDEPSDDTSTTIETRGSSVNAKPILSGLRFCHLWDLLRSRFGYTLEALPYEEWSSRLKARVVEVGVGHLLFPLLHVLERDGGRVGDVVEGWGGVGEEAREERGGKQDGWEKGGMDAKTKAEEGGDRVLKAVEANVRFLIGCGMLPPPPLLPMGVGSVGGEV